MPLARHPLEGLRASVLEPKPGPRGQVLHGAGHQDLTGSGRRGDSRADVDREPGYLLVVELDLARVEPRAHVEPECPDPVAQRAGATDGSGRAVEGREKPVARRVDLAASEPAELPADDMVMAIQKVPSAAIPESRGPLGRAHDVGEEHGGKDAVWLWAVPDACQELLDLVDDGVAVLAPGQMIAPGKLHELGARNLLGHEAAGGGGEEPIAGAVQDERRYADRRQHVPDVHLRVQVPCMMSAVVRSG